MCVCAALPFHCFPLLTNNSLNTLENHVLGTFLKITEQSKWQVSARPSNYSSLWGWYEKMAHITNEDIFNYYVVTWWVLNAHLRKYRDVSVLPWWKGCHDINQWQYWWPGIHEGWCLTKPNVWQSLHGYSSRQQTLLRPPGVMYVYFMYIPWCTL